MSEGGIVSKECAVKYFQLFVNRAAYTVQSTKPDKDGKYYYYRPKGERRLSLDTVLKHLRGQMTLGLYAINPTTQRSKWIAIDADYDQAIAHLLRLQLEFKKDGIQSALERSRRGAHLWIFTTAPLLARECRLYVLNVATRLNLPIKSGGKTEGLEIFPRQDRLQENEFGNAIRGPLGIHRAAGGKRFWFYDAPFDVNSQLQFLDTLEKLSEQHLSSLTEGLTIPDALKPRETVSLPPYDPTRREFRILDYVPKGRRSGREYRTKCPSCAAVGGDKNGDNLAVNIADPRKYKCWAGCTKEQIRVAVGCPIRQFTETRVCQANRMIG